MCGIALVVSGLRINLSSIFAATAYAQYEHHLQSHHVLDSNSLVEDLKAVLQRRGPDHLGTRKVYVQLRSSSSDGKEDSFSLSNVEEATKMVNSCLCFSGKKNECITSGIEVVPNDDSVVIKSVAELYLFGATLQLRGITPVCQPLVDSSGNVLVYNGEIFGGLHIDNNCNDAEVLLNALGNCGFCYCREYQSTCCCIEKRKVSIMELLSTIKGPWALIYWQDSSKTLWFGRDAFGRRSLLVHWPTLDDPRLLLSSVSPSSSIKGVTDSKVEGRMKDTDFWAELPCGIYSLKMEESMPIGCLIGEVRKHDWTDPVLNELINWERTYVECKSNEIYHPGTSVELGNHIVNPTHSTETSKIGASENLTSQHVKPGVELPASLLNGQSLHPPVFRPSHKVLIALKESVSRRTLINPIQETKGETMQCKVVPVAVLFSGGLDSMILAALLDKCLGPYYEIDLLNVSFDEQFAPDRISARAGVKELQRISPSRRWNLVEIDAKLSNLSSETEHVMSLINPSKTYMDLNIGIALWLAACGDGWVDMAISNDIKHECRRVKYKSDAKILLVGSGADEQCAGYSRHRTKYRVGGWLGLHEEMKLDMQRIWKRNLGRDDRCISDSGKEARFPFLDEDVIRTLLEIPLWEVADLNLPVGTGDKKILREVAQLLGIQEASFLPKRAIQFGSRIARESNRKNFGSNRAANQASAGSVTIQTPTDIDTAEGIPTNISTQLSLT